MNLTTKLLQASGYVAAGTLAVAGSASAAGMDFSAITAAIDASTIVAAIGAIAAIKILPPVAKWGFGQVISWFR